MKKIIIANWKMNPRTVVEAVRLARASDAKNVVIAPPFPFLAAVGKTFKKATLGAQDVFWAAPKGRASSRKAGRESAYTGEVSPFQLKALGVRYVIIGHSERRVLGETDRVVNKKAKAALSAGLKVILCVGEPLTVRKRGFASAKRFVKSQLASALKDIRNSKFSAKGGSASGGKIRNLLIAYEPIWAIGTGRAATPADASAMAQFIKKFLVFSFKFQVARVLYGGSVSAGNVGSFLAEPGIDGALVGGASLKPREFKKMVVIAGGL